MSTNEECLKGYKERIKVSVPLVNERSRELAKAEQDLKEGIITKERFLSIVNNHTEHIQMTTDQFNSLPLVDDFSRFVSTMKATESTSGQFLKAYLGPYRTRKQIVQDENINTAAIIVGTIEDNSIRYTVEKVDIIKDEE